MSSNVQQVTTFPAVRTGVVRHVNILDNQGHVSPSDPIHISRLAKDVVVWVSGNNRKATIVFASPAGSPFKEAVFHLAAGGSVCSDLVRDAATNGEYKYTVVGEKGTNDPVIIIDN